MKRQWLCELTLVVALVLLAAFVVSTSPLEASDGHPVPAGPTGGPSACSGDFTLAISSPTGVNFSDVAWGDYDDDGDLDILLSGHSANGHVTEVWRNEDGISFTQAVTIPAGIWNNSVAWGDYDDDGDLDILLAGYTDYASITQVWRNDGDTFALASTAPTGISEGDIAWGDYDDDGDLDILLAGNSSGSRVAEVWRNENGVSFTQAITTLTGVEHSAVAWGDYDDDGDLDILLAGNSGSEFVTEVWRNENGLAFTRAITSIAPVGYSAVAWGDYDRDGDLDILLAGLRMDAGYEYVTEVWRNEAGLTFTQAVTNLTGVADGSVAWGDYDDDGDLDILLAGESAGEHMTEIWRNDGGTFAQASSAPTAITVGSVAWGDYDDDGDLDILLAGSSPAGRVTQVWRNPRCPRPRGFALASSAPTGVSYADVAWGDYDDDGDLDVLLAGFAGWDAGGRVTQVWRNDGDDTFTLASNAPTGIEDGTVDWGDYDDDGDLDILLTGNSSAGHTTQVWRNDDGVTFALAITGPTDVNTSSAAWGDYDDDGDLDILLAGHTGSGYATEVWRNEGGLSFTQAITALTGVSASSVAWGDYDDDGDLDVLLAGNSGSGYVMEVWRNENGLAFTQTITTLPGITQGDVDWGDYDDDGDLDVLLVGTTGYTYLAEVWRNENGISFTLAITTPTGVSYSDAAWGDYDDDGDLDVLLAGDTGSEYVTEIWRNNGSGFALASRQPTGVFQAGVAWGDYDHDGDLDILLAGDTGSGYVTEIWRAEPALVYLPLVLKAE